MEEQHDLEGKIPSDRLRRRLGPQAYIEFDDGKFAIVDDPTSQLQSCHQFVVNVLAGGYECNLLTATPRQKRAYYRSLEPVLRELDRYPDAYVPGHIYHPAIKFLFEFYRAHPFSRLVVNDNPEYMLSGGTTVAEAFLEFIRSLKAEAARQGIRKKMADHDAKLKKNRRRLRRFAQELFRRCSRPVIVRIDLDYLATLFPAGGSQEFIREKALEHFRHAEIYANGEELDGRELPPMRASFEQVQKDRAKLFTNMQGKPSLFKHLIGYVWRFEYGLDAGFHLHLLLAFDGAHVRKHQWLAKGIGEYWVNDITMGRGRYHSSNAAWSPKKPTYGIGVIKWDDEHRRDNLMKWVLPYLAKFEQQVLARPYAGCKLMGSGFVHRDKPTNRGRPRSLAPTRPRPPLP